MTTIELLEKYRDIKLELAPKLEELKQLEKQIKSEISQTGELIQTDWVKTSFRKGYTKSSWDNKGLRGYAIANPDVLTFLKEIEVNPTVVIELI